MSPYNFSVLFFSFGAFFIALLIFLKRQDAIGRFYFSFSLLAAIWGVLFSIMISPNVEYQFALVISRILNVSAMFVPIVWFHFTLIITGNPKRKEKLLHGLYFGAIFISCFMFTPWFIPNLKSIGGFRHYPQAGPMFALYMILFLSVLPFGFVELINKIKTVDREESIQLKGLMVATLAGFGAALPTFLPCFGINMPQYGLFLMPVYPFVMAYFMMRKNLFNLSDLVEAVHRDKLAAIGTLATSINHEIRNPLYIIQGLAESYLMNLKEGIYSDQSQALQKSNEILEKTKSQALRAIDIMKQFAMFAKQDPKQEIKVEKVDLNRVLADVMPLVNHELELEKIRLVQNIQQGLPTVKVGRQHLEEILFNLIVNACQAIKGACTPEHNEESLQSKIEINAVQQNGHVNILIRDNGPGIPSGKCSQIFEPFYTTKEQGTGLGLYITKQLVEKSGGKIAVKSKPGEGTEFTLVFSSK